MQDYLMIIRGGDEGLRPQTEEAIAEHMAEWKKWMMGLAEKGQFGGGQPLKEEGKSIVDGGTQVVDRPLAEAKDLVGGYVILKAKSLDEATELAKGCPGLAHQCELEIREMMAGPM